MALGLPFYRLLVKSKARASLKPSPECLPTPFWMHCLRGSSYPEYFIAHQIQSWCFVPTWNDYSRPACVNLENCTKSWRRADPKQGVIFISLYMEIKHTHTHPASFFLLLPHFLSSLVTLRMPWKDQTTSPSVMELSSQKTCPPNTQNSKELLKFYPLSLWNFFTYLYFCFETKTILYLSLVLSTKTFSPYLFINVQSMCYLKFWASY